MRNASANTPDFMFAKDVTKPQPTNLLIRIPTLSEAKPEMADMQHCCDRRQSSLTRVIERNSIGRFVYTPTVQAGHERART